MAKNVMVGTADADFIRGTSGDDDIAGGAGNDTLKGGDGNDYVDGGLGNDIVSGGEGNDKVSGGKGDDFVSGGNGNDLLIGGEGNDILEGGWGADTFDFGAFNKFTAAEDFIVDFRMSSGDILKLSNNNVHISGIEFGYSDMSAPEAMNDGNIQDLKITLDCLGVKSTVWLLDAGVYGDIASYADYLKFDLSASTS